MWPPTAGLPAGQQPMPEPSPGPVLAGGSQQSLCPALDAWPGAHLGAEELGDPFYASTVPRPAAPGAPRPRAAEEARALAGVYQRLLESLAAAQVELEADQERLAWLLAEAFALAVPSRDLDVQVLLFQEGLQLRLREFEEESRRLAAVERRLQRSLDEAEVDCEVSAIRAAGVADPRLLERLEEQRRVIWLQQEELDRAHFERDVLADDAVRLREQCLLQQQEPEQPQEQAPPGDPFNEFGGLPAPWPASEQDGLMDAAVYAAAARVRQTAGIPEMRPAPPIGTPAVAGGVGPFGPPPLPPPPPQQPLRRPPPSPSLTPSIEASEEASSAVDGSSESSAPAPFRPPENRIQLQRHGDTTAGAARRRSAGASGRNFGFL